MRILASACLLLVALMVTGDSSYTLFVDAKKPSRAAGTTQRRGSSRGRSISTSRGRSAPVSRRRTVYEEEEEDEGGDEFGFPENDVEYDYEEEEDEIARPRPSKKRRNSGQEVLGSSRKPSRAGAHVTKKPKRSSKRYSENDYDYDEEEDYDRTPPQHSRRGRFAASSRRGPPPRYGRGDRVGRSRRSGGKVVPYGAETGPSAFTRGLAALRESIPDPASVRDAAANTIGAARQTTSKLSTQLYREVKGLTSSELEQVMLKATRPDDTPVKGKHVERLVGVTYQISPRYDIYDAVLRKLWNKMAEQDWRTTIKALYVLHRFSADGSPDHAAALKARLRELRRTRDPKRKDKFFNSKQLLAGTATPENMKFRAFMSRYAHYVLLRAQCFGGLFDEISQDQSLGKSKKPQKPKPITATSLRPEHLEAATMLLKAGLACSLRDGEECENTAMCVERVASDLIGLTSAVATALNRALKGNGLNGADAALLKRWCEFYSEELLPETKAMVKKTSAKLDAYGLFLPSRMGTSVSQEFLQKGLRAEEENLATEEIDNSEEEAEEDAEDKVTENARKKVEQGATKEKSEVSEENEELNVDEKEMEASEEEEDDEYDEYDYEMEEYYDDEDS